MKLEINESKSFTIYSREFWNETDVEIQSGEEYKFVAEGNWKDLSKETDANGYSNWYMSLFDSLKRSRNNQWFALIGSVNKSGGFLIGKNSQIPFQQNGKLWCYANDVRGFYWNNSGTVLLTVTRIK